MLGKQIAEGTGKRTGRRVTATEPRLQVEASVEERTSMLGAEGLNIITYTAQIKPDGSLEGCGEGAFATPQGDVVLWKGLGVGRFGEGGSTHYCGSISYSTTSPRFAALNAVSGVFQWDIE